LIADCHLPTQPTSFSPPNGCGRQKRSVGYRQLFGRSFIAARWLKAVIQQAD
jgi:hypothetical protein